MINKMNTVKEMQAVVKAIESGKPIECHAVNSGLWVDVKDKNILPDFSAFIYRVKPDKKIVPYKTILEFIEDQKKHGPYFKHKKGSCFYSPSTILENGNIYIEGQGYSLCTKSLLESYIWQDGAPCGKNVEE